MKICIIGGGSTYSPELLAGLIRLSKTIEVREIWLLDIEQGKAKLDILTKLGQRMLKGSGVSVRLVATLDPDAAVSEADFVVNQFRPGLLMGRINDEKIPLEFGLIGQETTGIGGLACAVRAFAAIEAYVLLIKKKTNGAWIINFTNPSGLLTEFIINYLGYHRCIGLCNCPVSIQMQVAAAFQCQREDVFLRYYGLNHLSWVDGFDIAGEDRTNEVFDLLRLNMENIPDFDYAPGFLEGLRLVPNPYLKYYYNSRKLLSSQIKARDTEGTRGEVIIRIEQELLSRYAEQDRIEPPPELSKRGGYMYSTVATEIIQSLMTGNGHQHIVNSRNEGAVSEFPDDYVMEIPASIDRLGPKTESLGRAHPAVVGLVHTLKNVERLMIEGYLKRDSNLIKQAMLIHPLGPNESQLEELWLILKKANSDYFPEFT